MIVKLDKDTWMEYSGENKDLLIGHTGEWFACVRPDKFGRINIVIEDKIIPVFNKNIVEIINDDRYLYELCSYCSMAQDAGLEQCVYCKRDRSYLKPFYYKEEGRESFDEILKESVRSVFNV